MSLISTEELAGRIGDPKVRILDARWYIDPTKKGIDAYTKGHIPGAFFADLDADFSAPGGAVGGPIGRHPFPSPQKVQQVIRLFGITSGVTVVAYDDVGGAMAGRVWSVLRVNGFDDCRILDGGLTKWVAEGREVTDQPPSISTMTDFVVSPRPDLVVSKEWMIREKDQNLVFDSRAAERYRGETEPLDPRAGHIPGARNFPFTKNLTGGSTPVFKSPEELRAQFEAAGITEDTSPVFYCGSGITAAHNLLALHLAGFSGRLYAGSYSEWCSDPALPVAKGDES